MTYFMEGKKYFFTIAFVFLFFYNAIAERLGFNDTLLPTAHKGYIIHHNYYTISYSEKDRQAEWVAYPLTPQSIKGTQVRKNSFKPDPMVKQNPVVSKEYTKTGFDRGHLCPAADMKLNLNSMSESFYLSNISPQFPGFNRGIWENLESKVREWAIEKNGLYVVTGSIINYQCGSISNETIPVPCFFYKIIFKDFGSSKQMIAFLLPNESNDASLNSFITTVDKIEQLTGIDFFASLPNQTEELLESSIVTSNWSW